MDWTGLGIAIFFGFLAFAVKNMPPAIAWGGVAVGLVLLVWRHLPFSASYNGALILAAGAFVLAASAAAWGISIHAGGSSIVERPAEKAMSSNNEKPPRDWPKAGDVIGRFGAGMPRSGEMPKAGDVLGGFGAGLPNQDAPQPAPFAANPNAVEQPKATNPSTYSIGNIYDNKGIIQQGPNNTVNLVPQPELRGIQSDQIANADGTFTHRYLVMAGSPCAWEGLTMPSAICQVGDNRLTKLFVKDHAFFDEGFYILCGDHGDFFNHSDNPNVYSRTTETYAARDIECGEELTDNYNTYDEEPVL